MIVRMKHGLGVTVGFALFRRTWMRTIMLGTMEMQKRYICGKLASKVVNVE